MKKLRKNGFHKYQNGLTSSSSLSPTLSSLSDDAILFLRITVYYADPNKFIVIVLSSLYGRESQPVQNQKFRKMLGNQDHTLLLILTRPME